MLFLSTIVLADIRRTPGDLDAAFVIVNNVRIGNGPIQYFAKGYTLEQCVMSCVKNLACASFNLHPSTGACELLSGKFDISKKVWPALDWQHYDTPEKGKFCLYLSKWLFFHYIFLLVFYIINAEQS